MNEDLTPYLQSAFRVIAEKGWRDFTLDDVDTLSASDEAYQPPWRDKLDVLRDFGAMIDAQVAHDVGEGEPGLSARERLFEVLMARFDALTPYRDAIDHLARAALVDPRLGLFFARALPRSMQRMLHRAHIKETGFEGLIKARVLGLIWLDVVRIWLRDDSADMGKTMAALDKALGRIEPYGERLFPHDR